MRALGIRFGKGLQLVNILRDREADSVRGRTYVQAERLDEVLADARGHLQAARAYVRALRNYRLRVACALPLFLAEETLDLVERNPSAPRVKVPRQRVWILLLRAFSLRVGFEAKNQRPASVTAPSEAVVTRAAYFANTPRR